MFQPEADIYLNRLKENLHSIQTLVGKAKIMAVIKANAYGHGLVPIARTLSKSGVHGFCVALISEAQKLIHSVIQEPILNLGRMNKNKLLIDSNNDREGEGDVIITKVDFFDSSYKDIN